MRVKNFAVWGNADSQYLSWVRAQLGSEGCKRAQLVWRMAGCAGEVMGTTFARAGCDGTGKAGKRIGEVKAGQWSLLSAARASTISKVLGHGLEVALTGYVGGRSWMYSGLRARIKRP